MNYRIMTVREKYALANISTDDVLKNALLDTELQFAAELNDNNEVNALVSFILYTCPTSIYVQFYGGANESRVNIIKFLKKTYNPLNIYTIYTESDRDYDRDSELTAIGFINKNLYDGWYVWEFKNDL